MRLSRRKSKDFQRIQMHDEGHYYPDSPSPQTLAGWQPVQVIHTGPFAIIRDTIFNEVYLESVKLHWKYDD